MSAVVLKGMLRRMRRRYSIEESSLEKLAAASSSTPTKDSLLTNLPSMRSCPPQDRRDLFIRKLRLCSIIFDFTDTSKETNLQKAKEGKQTLLLDLVDYIDSINEPFNEIMTEEVVTMVCANIIRSLPPISDVFDPDEDDPVYEASWPHLQIVYELFLRFIISTHVDVKILKKHLNHRFVLEFLSLFNSTDERERDYLKIILHRLYGKFMSLRAFIRKSIHNIFYNYIYDNTHHNGVGELLEILGSIINGFSIPLKEEHKAFLSNVLIPVHSSRHVNTFYKQLSYCVTQFVEKDKTLIPLIVNGILQHWPHTNSQKEVFFLNELEEVLEICPVEQFQICVRPVFERIAKAIQSPHFQVAERALKIWENGYVGNLVLRHKEIIFPLVFPSLKRNSDDTHWHEKILTMSQSVLTVCNEMDSDLYQKCIEEHLRLQKLEKEKYEEHSRRLIYWESLEQGIFTRNN